MLLSCTIDSSPHCLCHYLRYLLCREPRRFHALLLFIIHYAAIICSEKTTWQVQRNGQERSRERSVPLSPGTEGFSLQLDTLFAASISFLTALARGAARSALQDRAPRGARG